MKSVTTKRAALRTKKCDLVVSRQFNAPVEEVWKAWTDAGEVTRWWGPYGFTSPSAKMDFREGGTSLVCMRAPKELGGQDTFSTWTYTKIALLRSIEYIHNLADERGTKMDPVKLGMPADFPQDQRHQVIFNRLTEGSTEVIVTEYGWTPGQMLSLSKIGLNQCLEKMGRTLEKKN